MITTVRKPRPSGAKKVTVFETPGAATFTPQPTSRRFEFHVIGGGGGGGGEDAGGDASGGGGGGYGFKVVERSAFTTTVAIVVGAGGTGGKSAPLTQATAGGASSFTTTLPGSVTYGANGGAAGLTGSLGNVAGGTVGAGFDIALNGGYGHFQESGAGAGPFGGDSAPDVHTTTNGVDGLKYGAGGGEGPIGFTGGAGASGAVIVFEYE